MKKTDEILTGGIGPTVENRYVTTELRVHRESTQPQLKDLVTLMKEWGMFSAAQETCWVITYDAVTNIRTVNEIARGNYYEVRISIPSMMTAVLAAGTDRFYVIHNHPSGEVTPTKMDVDLTKQIMAASNTIGLYFEDHVVIGPPDKVFSMNAHGIVIPSSDINSMVASKRHDAILGGGQPVWEHREER